MTKNQNHHHLMTTPQNNKSSPHHHRHITCHLIIAELAQRHLSD